MKKLFSVAVLVTALTGCQTFVDTP
ncbi:lipoprotein [Moraxella boevrei]